MDIITAISDEKLFRPVFKDLDTWGAWFTLLKAFFGRPMTEADLGLYYKCTGRENHPGGEFKELWAVIGRRGGKSFIASATAVYLALFYNYKQHLSPGERGVIQIIAADRAQAQVILRYIKGILNSNEVFTQYVENEYRERIDLTNDLSFEVMSCSFRSIRGRTLICAILDESSFWRIDGANPDGEILAALRPGLATIPNSKLIVISSPYSRTGILHDHYQDYHGKDDPDILVWQAETRLMNPTIPQSLIDREMQKDPSAARAEWLAEWRDDIESFLTAEAIDACVVPGRRQLPPQDFVNYAAFVDPSGGRRDAMTLAISHTDNDRLIIDYLGAWTPPFDPGAVVVDMAQVAKDYRVSFVVGDRYGAAWVESAFKKAGIKYEPCKLTKSDLYLNFEARLNTRQVELPDNEHLRKELIALERRRGRAGKDIVDHGPRGRDDLANAVAGACYEGFKYTGLIFPELRRVADGKVRDFSVQSH